MRFEFFGDFVAPCRLVRSEPLSCLRNGSCSLEVESEWDDLCCLVNLSKSYWEM